MENLKTILNNYFTNAIVSWETGLLWAVIGVFVGKFLEFILEAIKKNIERFITNYKVKKYVEKEYNFVVLDRSEPYYDNNLSFTQTGMEYYLEFPKELQEEIRIFKNDFTINQE